MKMWPKDFKKINKADDQATSAASQSRMSLPFQPLTIAFSNISYYVDVPKVNYRILVSPITPIFYLKKFVQCQIYFHHSNLSLNYH